MSKPIAVSVRRRMRDWGPWLEGYRALVALSTRLPSLGTAVHDRDKVPLKQNTAKCLCQRAPRGLFAPELQVSLENGTVADRSHMQDFVCAAHVRRPGHSLDQYRRPRVIPVCGVTKK